MGTTEDRRGRHALVALAVVNALPAFATRHPPFADLPEHVAAMATFARLATEPAGPALPYEVSTWASQYFFFHLVGGALTLVTRDAVVTAQILLAASAIAWTLAFAALCRAMGRAPRLALLAPALFWNRAVAMGFLPFVASVPLALWALSLVVRRRAGATLAVAGLLVFYTHVSAWVLLVASAFLWAPFAWRSGSARPRELAALALSLVPSAVAALIWWASRSLATGNVVEVSSRFPLDRALRTIPFWTFDVWTSHVDDVCGALYWAAFALVLVSGLRRSRSAPRASAALLPYLPLAVAGIALVATPFSVGPAAMLNVRLAPVVALFAILPLAPARSLGGAGLALACVATVVNAGNTAFEARRAEREGLGDLDRLLAHAAPGSRLAMLDFARPGAGTHFWPYIFAGAYHRARGGAVASWSFTELPHWSLRYVPGMAPPKRRPFANFDPCLYRYREDGAYFDHVLVNGKERPFGGGAPGPRFVPLASEGTMVLYGKAGEETSTEEPDRGPCEPPPKSPRSSSGQESSAPGPTADDPGQEAP
jgi:hypothetical protein